jgi:hypothetical protein
MRRTWLFSGVVFVGISLALTFLSAKVELPYDKSCPVVYDNDSAEDMYTDEYLMALASAGDISLRGIIGSSGGWREPKFPDPTAIFERDAAMRVAMVKKARRSGMRNIPEPVRGADRALVKPDSGRIEDTVPVDCAGARLIVREAQKASESKPLVLVMGGVSTVAASAYLMNPAISNHMVLAWMGGSRENEMKNFNDTVNRWATYIVLQRLRIVLFGSVAEQAPYVPKRRLKELPETELRQWMIEKELPHVHLPGEHDYDCPPAIALMRADYVRAAKRKSFSRYDESGDMYLKDDRHGNVLVITRADQAIATSEWWRALKNAEAYAGRPLPDQTVHTADGAR